MEFQKTFGGVFLPGAQGSAPCCCVLYGEGGTSDFGVAIGVPSIPPHLLTHRLDRKNNPTNLLPEVLLFIYCDSPMAVEVPAGG